MSISLVFAARPAAAQVCSPVPLDSIESLRSLRISAIHVMTGSPDKMPGPVGVLANLHVRTSDETIRRQISMRVGDPLDPVRAGEAIHRLRRQPYIADARLELSDCVDTLSSSRSAALRFVTRDAWSTRPTVNIRSSASALFGLEERNLVGTGRSAKVYLRSESGRMGVGVAYSDPWVFNSPLSATLSRNVFRDGSDWRAILARRQHSIFDPWNADLTLASSSRVGFAGPDSLQRSIASLRVSRLWRASAAGATSLIAGFEGERGRLSVMSGVQLTGPRTVTRKFAGADLGISRRSARYRVVDWYLPGGAATDLPAGFEGEGIVAFGRDFTSGSPAMHFDLWGGRIWLPRRDIVAAADMWFTGYVNQGMWSAGRRRTTLSLFKEAPRGMWVARAAGEQLVDPDPDIRALSNMDPTMHALSRESRLAESAASLSLERAVHLFPPTRGYMLDGALFSAISSRWDPAATADGRISLAVLGAGFRLMPTRVGRASLRFDAGYPVIATPGVKRRIFFGVSLVPWIEAGRSRQN